MVELQKLILWYLNQVRNVLSVKIQLLINGHKLDQVKEAVFSGVIVDENLNWKSEISQVANKVQSLLEIFINLVSTCRQNLNEPYIFH